MIKQKIYIAGKITGTDLELTQAKFEMMENHLAEKGYTPINPMKLDHSKNINKIWEDYMSVCLAALEKCDAIFLLDCWIDSKGAKIEVEKAKELGLKVFGIV